MGPEFLIPILVPLGFFAMLFGIWYVRSRENMAMIDKGMNPRTSRPVPQPYANLKWGLLLVGSGLGLLLAYLLDEHAMPGRDNEALYFSLIGIFGGLGLIVSYRIEKKEVLDKIPVE